jgi:hypothetical protein
MYILNIHFVQMVTEFSYTSQHSDLILKLNLFEFCQILHFYLQLNLLMIVNDMPYLIPFCAVFPILDEATGRERL